jgi:YVTN family beta-propeller protein
METGARARLDSILPKYLFRTCRKTGPVLALAAAIFVTGFVPRAAADGVVGVVGYVANSADNTVSLLAMDQNNNVVTGLTGSALQTVTVGTAPVRVAVAPNNLLVFVTNQSTNSITVIDPTTNTALPTTIPIAPIGSGPAPTPQGIAVLENGAAITLYVANPGDNSVSIIDATNIKTGRFTQLARLTTGVGPTPIEVVLQGANAYVLNNNHGGVGTVSTINTGTNTIVPQAIQVAHNATGLAASPDGQVIYITNRGDNSVTSVKVSNLVQTQITGITDPVGVAFDPNPGAQNGVNRVAYVANFSTGSLTEIIDDAICDNAVNGQCFLPNPLVLPAGAHPSQVQVVAGGNESQVFISDPIAGNVLSFAPFDAPTVKTFLAGNVASGLAFVAFPDSTNPATPVCGLTQSLDGSGDNVQGICVGGGANGTNPVLSFQTDQGFSCSGQNQPCPGNQGFVGGFQDYGNVAAGVYTVIVCSDQNQTPPNCTVGTSAQQLIAWPGSGTAPTVTCAQFTATPDTTQGLSVDASAVCGDGVFSLPNNTNPRVNLALIMKLDWGDGTFPFLAQGTQVSGNKIQPPAPAHQYAKAGTYTVTLSAADTTLLAATPQTASVTVADAVPACTFPAPSVNNFAVTAAPTCFDEFHKPVTQIVINWGQGVPNSPTTLTGVNVNQPTTFTYPTTTAQTTFTISVVGTAQSPSGQPLSSTPVTQQVTVPSFVPQPPSCVISASATMFSAQAPVTCNVTATGDVIQSVLVTWGDGSSTPATPGTASFTQTFQHTYAAASATYTITVVATDLTGLQGTAQTTVTIVGPVAPRCSLNVQSTGGFGASATAQCVSDDATLASVAVDFGDGTVVQGTAGSPTFGPQTFNHTYAVAGTYTITLTATDSLQLVTRVTGSVTVPTLTITGSGEATISAGGTATFTVSVPASLVVTNPPLTLSCVPNPPQTTLPPGFVCLFSPANISPGQSSILTIATNSVPPSTTSALRIPSLYGLSLALLPAMLLVGSAARRRKTGATRLGVLCLVLVLVLGLAGCGTNPPPVSSPATSSSGTFTVQVQVADATQKVLGTSTVTVTIK